MLIFLNYICQNLSWKFILKNGPLVIFILHMVSVCWSQQTISNYMPDYYTSSILEHNALMNPAWVDEFSKASLGSLYKSRTGLLNEVSSMTAYGDLSITPLRTINQSIRAIFQNEKEGPYISSPKFYGNYAIRLPITDDIFLYTGIALGISSLSFTAPSGMGKASVPDGSIGGIFKYKKTEIGTAAYQIFNNSSIVINSSLVFRRYYQFYVQSEKDLSASVSIKGHLFWRPQAMYDLASTTALLCYKEIISAGILYQYRRGTSFLTSFHLNKDNNPIIVNLSYNSLLFNTLSISTGSFEIGLQYRIGK